MKRWAVAGCLVLGLASLARAEIYKCQGPNGDVRFTSDPSQCPNAPPHAPSQGSLQRTEKATAPLVSARPGSLATPHRAAADAADAGAGSEQLWKKKKRDAEGKLLELQARIEYVSNAVAWCNRGNSLWSEDSKTGLRHDVPCTEVDAEYAALQSQEQDAKRYLAEGLEEECRRAGCLPGWLR